MEPLVKLPLIDKMEFIDDILLRRVAPVLSHINAKEIRPIVNRLSLESECRYTTVSPLTVRAAAVRHLLSTLRREADPRDRQGILEYLHSLRMAPDTCEEVAHVLNEATFATVPPFITLRPALISLQWKIDLSYCQRCVCEGRLELEGRACVLLLLRCADGSSRAIVSSLSGLAGLRLELSRSIQAARAIQRKLHQREEPGV